MKEILFLCHRIPYPPNKGDKIRSYHLLRHLAREYRVHLGTFIDDAHDHRFKETLGKLCGGETHFATLSPTLGKMRALRGFFTGEPLTLPYYRQRGFMAWVERIRRERPLSLVVAFSSGMAQFVSGPQWQGIPRVIDFVDVDSLKWTQYASAQGFPMNRIHAREGRTLMAYETRIAAAFDASWVVHAEEKKLLDQHAPASLGKIHYFNNGTRHDYFDPALAHPNPYKDGEQVILFTGAMDYWANVDAVVWFAREVFPLVLRAVPGASFVIAGARPTRAVLELTWLPGIRVTGRVEEMRPYLAHARLAVAPLRIAQGVQNKVLEAMAMKIPVMATPAAVLGIAPCPGVAVMVAEHPEGFAKGCIDLLNGRFDPKRLDASRRCILEHYDWEKNLQGVSRLLTALTSQQPQPAPSGGPLHSIT